MKKYYSLEFLRFLSSMSVLIYHYRHFYSPLNILSADEFNIVKDSLPFSRLLGIIYEYGFYGVHIFYVISGFVFAHVYLKIREHTSFKEFSVNRLSRLYPLHFVTLVIVALLQLAFFANYENFQFDYIIDFYHFFLQIFFISSWGFEAGHSFNGPIWSVSVEMGIYLVFFILINLIKKYELKFIILINILLVIADKTGISSLFLDCARLFFSGVLIYYLILSKQNFIITFSVSLILLFFSFVGNFKTFLFCPALILFFLSFENFITKKEIKNKCITFGNWTYALYLLHVPFQLMIILIIEKFFNFTNIYDNYLFFIFYFILLFVVSNLVFNFYEKPLNRIFRKLFLK